MFVYCFVDPVLRVEIISRKEWTVESGGIDFEILDIARTLYKKNNYLYFLLLYRACNKAQWLSFESIKTPLHYQKNQ